MAFGDNSFGPHLASLFDFTLTFEQTILTLLPGGIFLLALPLRLRALLRLQKCVASRQLLATKMVGNVLNDLHNILFTYPCLRSSAPVSQLFSLLASSCGVYRQQTKQTPLLLVPSYH